MRRLRVFYQNNKEKIWKVLGITILIFILVRIANYVARINYEEERRNYNNNINNTISYTPSQSIISDTNVSKEKSEKDIDIIETFIEYCNNGQVSEAYQLLSEDCKNELFSTEEEFYNNYYKDIFTEKKSYDVELWSSSGLTTYKIKILSNIMASGSVSNEFIEDYYSIVVENGESKLNIKNFVNNVEINKTKSIENIDFNVLSKQYYIDYEIVEIEVKNNSDKKVVLDTKENTETVFIEDTSGVEYPWYGHEVADNLLEIESGQTRSLKIKFNKMYNPNRKDGSIHFEDIQIEGEKNLRVEIGI